jgi:hypothetical protein
MKDYKVVHFSDEFNLDDINEALSATDDIIYYTRDLNEKNEFHVVNYKEGDFTITPFITQMFNFYKTNKLSHLVKESKVKGNDKFAIIVNTNEDLINRLKNDLNLLLKK